VRTLSKQPGGFLSHLLGTGVPPERNAAGMTPAEQPDKTSPAGLDQAGWFQ